MKQAIFSFSNRTTSLIGFCAAVLAGFMQVGAQQPGTSAPGPVVIAAETGSTEPSRMDSSYRLGPGDVIQLRVSKHTELSRDAIRIDNDGTVTISRIEGALRAACRTERELANLIKERYDSFLVNPEVEVSVREYNSQPVSVIGAVNAPGRFQLQRSARLLELLMLVNGPSGGAGRSVHIVHTSDGLTCDAPNSANLANTEFVAYALEKTLRAEESSNPYVRPGDIVRIPEADQVYITGNVKEPKALALKDEITLSRAIAMVGGVLPESNIEKIRILRQREGAGQTELIANLKAINKRQAPDIVLQANDAIEIPGAGAGRKFFQGIMKSIFPGLMQYPLYVIR